MKTLGWLSTDWIPKILIQRETLALAWDGAKRNVGLELLALVVMGYWVLTRVAPLER